MKITFKKQVLYLFFAWSVISLLIAIGMKAVVLLKDQETFPDKTILFYFLVQLITGGLAIILYVVPGFNIIVRKKKALKIFLFCLHGICFSFGWIAIFSFIRELFANHTITDEFFPFLLEEWIRNFHHAARTYLIFLTILLALDYFAKNTNAIIQKKNLENEINTIKLDTLKAQLQPHFLFNALNNIIALIDENKTKAQEILIDLSDLLRFTIKLKPEKLVEISQEINILKKYVEIEKAKYEDNLIVEWQVNQNIKGFFLPPLIMQPLLENSIKHGFIDQEGILHVIVRVENRLIEVKNNGKSLRPDFQDGHGISIVKNRLSIHYGRNFGFKLYQKEGWVINKITLDEDL